MALEVVTAVKVPGATEVCWHGRWGSAAKASKSQAVWTYIVNVAGRGRGRGPVGLREPRRRQGSRGWVALEAPCWLSLLASFPTCSWLHPCSCLTLLWQALFPVRLPVLSFNSKDLLPQIMSQVTLYFSASMLVIKGKGFVFLFFRPMHKILCQPQTTVCA